MTGKRLKGGKMKKDDKMSLRKKALQIGEIMQDLYDYGVNLDGRRRFPKHVLRRLHEAQRNANDIANSLRDPNSIGR
jgi:hypothetical protein